MPESYASDTWQAALREALAQADTVRIELRRNARSDNAVGELLTEIADAKPRAAVVARIAAAAVGEPAVERVLATAGKIELWLSAVTAARGAIPSAALERIRARDDRPVAVAVEVDRRLVGRLDELVRAAAALQIREIVFEPSYVDSVERIEASVYFDQRRYNDDLGEAIKTGKRQGVLVSGIRFGSQGAPETAIAAPGHRRVLVVRLKATSEPSTAPAAFEFLPSLRRLDDETEHFHPRVIETPVFRARFPRVSSEQRFIERRAATFHRYGLDEKVYLEAARRLEIDPLAAMAGEGSAAIYALNAAIDRRFFERPATGGTERLVVHFVKPFLGYNWGPARDLLLPDQHQHRRYFNGSQTPTVLLQVSTGRSYRVRTIVHDATPGDNIDYLQVSCNGTVAGDQAIQWEGRDCVHVCTLPAELIEGAGGRVRLSYSLVRCSGERRLATVSFREMTIEPFEQPDKARSVVTRLRSMIRLESAIPPSPQIGVGEVVVPDTEDAATAQCTARAKAIVAASGFVLPEWEGAVAGLGSALADLCARGMIEEAARQALDAGGRLERGHAAWMKPSPVEHRYGWTESIIQCYGLVRQIVEARHPSLATPIFEAMVKQEPQSRPAWLALAECHLAAQRYDEAIAAAREAVHHDTSCLPSQEMLRRAYRAKYPESTETTIDGVPVYDLSDRFCSVPFERIESAKDGIIWTCCPSWLGAPIGNLHRMAWEEAWNSDQAALVRQSILEGDYKYCNKGVCPAILGNGLPRKAEVTDPHFRHYIDHHVVKLPEGPREISLSHDPSCNLACPQCRNDFILADKGQNDAFSAAIDSFIKPLIEFAHLDKSVILMSGDGEIFVSPHYRAILKLFDPDRHGGIALDLLSNGLVFETGWEKVPNIHKLVRKITISTDAASAEVYAQTRGGSWPKLYRNLEFISGLRRRGEITYFGIHYAVQACNYKDMRRMVEIANDLGIDRIGFAILRNGGTYDPVDYAARAIFERAHPEHEVFVAELRDDIFRRPFVDLTQFAGFLVENDA